MLFELPIIPVVFTFQRCRIGHRIVKLWPHPRPRPGFCRLQYVLGATENGVGASETFPLHAQR